MAGDDDILDSSDGLNDAERAEFAQMQEATSGDAPPNAGADAGTNDGVVDAGAVEGAAVAGASKDGTAKDGVKDGVAADPAAASADDDDDEPEGAPVLDATGKPVLAADGKPARRKARVSANKYNAEKQRADKLDGELRTTRESMARYDERMRLLSEALTTPKPDAKNDEPEQDIDLEADIFGGVNQIRNQTRKEIADLRQAVEDMRAGKQTEDGQRVVADAYMQDATAMAAREPNFVPAYNHLMASRTQELAMYFCGVDLTNPEARKLTPAEVTKIKSVAAEEERGIVENAISRGDSPAQAVYQMARYRGFVPQKPQTAEEKAAAAAVATNGKGANGAAKPNGNGASVSDEIARIKAGSEAALSLSDGGASPANPMTPQRLADMPQDQFDAIMDRADPEEIRVLFEGRA